MSAVDVIVPCYRYGHFLRECVDSVLAQQGVPVRVLVIDDASPDDTPRVAAELARRDARVTVRRHERNCGHIATYNEGIAWVRAPYFLLLSADDFLLPGALARAVALMEHDPRIALCFGQAIEQDADGGSRPASAALNCAPGQTRIVSTDVFLELCRQLGVANPVPTPTAVVRTQVQRRTDGYRPELPHTADLEMWLRLAAHGPVGYVGDDQAVYRRHNANMSLDYGGANHLADLEQRLAAIDCFGESCRALLPDIALLVRRMRRALARQALHDASRAFSDGGADAAAPLIRWARTVDPHSLRSLRGLVLAIKHSLGPRNSQALMPVLGALRRTALRMLR